MKWTKFTIDTTTAAEDLVSDLLASLGVEGVETEDHLPLSEADTKGMFIDILPDFGVDDGTAKVSFYLADPSGWEDLHTRISQGIDELRAFVDVGPCTVTVSSTEDQDWANKWKENFKPFTVENLLISPTWETVPDDADQKILIRIDPGMAFGTGKHETTQLCLKELIRHVTGGCRVLDVGTGSGILGIASLKLGAGEVVGTDLDENAVAAVRENREANEIPEELFPVILGNLIDDAAVQEAVGKKSYDIAVANILAPVIILLQGMIAKYIRHGGVFIMSGILAEKAESVLSALSENPGFEVTDTESSGEWVCITARRL